MQRRNLFTLAIFSTVLTLGSHGVLAAGKHDHSPKHGGVVAEVGDLDIELVVKPDAVQLFLRDHNKPVRPDGMSAKVTLLAGTAKSEATLMPAGDRLEAKGAFNPVAGLKAVVVVTLPGKAPVTARFSLK